MECLVIIYRGTMQRQGSLDIHTYKPVVLGVVPGPTSDTSTHKLLSMSPIEKLQETWTSSSITTLFHVASSATTSRTFPAAGFNWYLGLRGIDKKSRSSAALFFYSRDCP